MISRRVYIYFALTFLLGILAGGAGTFYFGRQLSPPGGPARRERILRRMMRELNLDEKQSQQIRAIMEETGGKIGDLRRQHRPEFDAIRAASRDRIRAVLRAEQATKFDEMVKKFDERRQKRTPPPD